MHTTPLSSIHRLVGLGVLLATVACSGSGDEGGTGTTTVASTSTGTGDASTETTGPASSPTTGTTTGDDGSSSSSSSSGGTTTNVTGASTSTGSTSDATTGDSGATTTATSSGDAVSLGVFVSSTGSATGDLGGLEGADQRCQDLADAVGAGARTWHAYLSVENGPNDQPVHARDRIGAGPWYNAKLVKIAEDVADLHTKDGDHEVFLDENGEMVPGQWEGSPAPNQHDILTGTNKDGTVAVGKTCTDWTSEDPAMLAIVGHSDGLGPMMNDAEQYRPWNSVHENGGCHDTAPKGGAGRIYCFAVD